MVRRRALIYTATLVTNNEAAVDIHQLEKYNRYSDLRFSYMSLQQSPEHQYEFFKLQILPYSAPLLKLCFLLLQINIIKTVYNFYNEKILFRILGKA